MQIYEIKSIETILELHKNIFGKEFPINSYYKKKSQDNILIFGYNEEENLIGYSIVVAQTSISNLYAWYGGVLPSYQNHGITQSFLQYLVEYARMHKFNSITLASSNLRPHMLRLAIKLGFDIVDIKKRTEGEGNKIYFRLDIKPESKDFISLKEFENSECFTQLEKIAVKQFKNNCNVIYVQNPSEKPLRYFIRYHNSFARQPHIIVVGGHIENEEAIKKEYKGTIVFKK